ncbi:hypothetical protein LA080_001378 [Diaporthe eres]|nr:hypothetical protein LA080_001378 [Diaporthe eres]
MEISPIEVGNADIKAYIPTWSWGRTFQAAKSIDCCPEQSLSLILGQCTSAPAGPITGYISALLASLPKDTLMSRALLLLNKFVRMKRWESFWGNPIRAGHDPNPFYGHTPEWEGQTRTILIDGGMSNNLPNHVLARPERAADIIISFDTSSDVQTGAATTRMYNFAKDCNMDLEDVTALFNPPRQRIVMDGEKLSAAAMGVENKFLHMYARVFHGRREDGRELYIVYCPLLPNAVRPDFDPSTAAFSTSYNLVWTPEQIKLLLATSEANVEYYATQMIKQVALKVTISLHFSAPAMTLAMTTEAEQSRVRFILASFQSKISVRVEVAAVPRLCKYQDGQ